MSMTTLSQLPALRRYGALLLGSKRIADDHLERLLIGDAIEDGVRGADPYAVFHATPLPTPDLSLDDFARADHHLLVALHKLAPFDRALLLLTTTASLGHERVAGILGGTAADIRSRLARARSLIEASCRNRLCMIVEDDLIAMRDLQAELAQERMGIAGMAKNRTEALGLAEDMRPDIALIDLALPEGATAGADVAERLRERSATRIIFVTAFTKIAKGLAGPKDMIVPKPWSTGSLKQAIASATA